MEMGRLSSTEYPRSPLRFGRVRYDGPDETSPRRRLPCCGQRLLISLGAAFLSS